MTYCYDNLPDGGACRPTEPIAGYRGRLTYVANATSSTLFGSFDTMGRVLGSTQTTGGTPFAFSYVYDLAGELASLTYPSGRTVITAYEEAGRPAGLTGSKGGVNTAYVQAAHYGPQGAPSQIRFASGLYEETCHNSLLQPVTIRLGTVSTQTTQCTDSTDALHLTFGYGSARSNNGNVMSAGITARPPEANMVNASQTFGYDAVNRLNASFESGVSGRSHPLQLRPVTSFTLLRPPGRADAC